MIIKKKSIYIFLVLLLVLIIILLRQNDVSKNMIPEISNNINLISHKNIYFGHRSVGENIISGINKIISKEGRKEFVIKELKSNSKIDGNYFFHSNIGRNGDPKSKFKEFTDIVNNLANKNLEIAMMKLCFVDITKKTNINEVFQSYVAMIDSLQNKYPNLTFIHFTVPLKSKPSWIHGIKNFIKNRDIDDQQDNINRNKYNELLLTKYPRKYIFDLAGFESTYPSGKRESIVVNGELYYSLIKDYTDDGGHLNELGQQVIASEFINKLVEIITLKIQP